MIIQRIEKNCASDIAKAIKYYTVLFSLNNKQLSSKEIELIAFTAVKGTISSPTARQEFIESFDSSAASLENIKCKLVKRNYLVKYEKKHRVHPLLYMDFTKDLVIQIKLFKEENHDTISSERTNTIGEIENRVVQQSE